jgi:hypothetical protein
MPRPASIAAGVDEIAKLFQVYDATDLLAAHYATERHASPVQAGSRRLLAFAKGADHASMPGPPIQV